MDCKAACGRSFLFVGKQ